MNEPRKSRAGVWIEAMRLRTLPVSIAGVAAGCGCAAYYGGFRLVPAVICLLFAVLAQVASNFANEYYDFKGGLDRKGREGFRRGVTEGDISPRQMRNATYATLGVAALLGLSLLLFGSWWLLPCGIAIALFAVGYSTGPYPLSHHGLGDVAVVVFFGLVPVTLTAYVQAGTVAFSPMVWCIALAVGLLASNVLIVNNYRDMDDDAAVGKKTTVVLFGRRVMSAVYLLSVLTAAAVAAAVTMPSLSPWWWLMYAALAAAGIALYRQIRSRTGAALNPLLGKTAVTLLVFAVALCIALASNPLT